MAISRPNYIKPKSLSSYAIGQKWDDMRASDDFEFDTDPFYLRSTKLQFNAQIALGIGIYEWLFWLFSPHISRPEPQQVLEALWCGAYKPEKFTYIEFDRMDWLGNIHGPMWCAMMFASAMVNYRDEDEGEVGLEEGLVYLPRLAVHVLPEETEFLSWLEFSLVKLGKYYTAEPSDPFTNLFGSESSNEPLVPREALDPGIEFDPKNTSSYVSYLLEELTPDNPFLKD